MDVEEGETAKPELHNQIDKHSSGSRWLTVFLAGYIMCGSHYARDAVGALERQIETDLSITADQYATINSVYFIPSIFAPILAGIFTNYLGGAAYCLLYAVVSSSFGHLIFSLGIQFDNICLIYIGRSIAGFMYEIIDSVPIVVLVPLFQSQWGLVVGLLNGFLRLGSVMNFVITPIIYNARGVKDALWFATAVASSTILSAGAIFLSRNNGNGYDQLNVSSHEGPNHTTSCDITYATIIAKADSTASTACSSDSESDSLSPDMTSYNMKNTNDSDHNITNKEKTNDEETLILFEQTDSAHFLEIVGSEDIVDCGEEKTVSKVSMLSAAAAVMSKLAIVLPLHLFQYQYYMFLLSGAFLYGSMVPFWFLGSKFLQDHYSLTVGRADALMLFPEGMIAIVSVPIGYLLDLSKCNTKSRLKLLSVACLFLPISYTMLAYGFYSTSESPASSSNTDSMGGPRILHTSIPPLVTMCAIGLAYAVSNSLYWSTVMDILPKGDHFSAANGLIASCLNVLPSFVPPFLIFAASFNKEGDREDAVALLPLHLLSALGCCASLFSFLATLERKS